MGLLDDVLGGLGDDAAGGLGHLLKGQGGVAGLTEKFGANGLGDVVGSWIGKGANAGVSPEQISQVLGRGPIAEFARRLGVSPEQASETLAGLLPEAVDRLTPGGRVEDADGGLGDLLGGFLKR